MVSVAETAEPIGSTSAEMRSHYDSGNRFFGLWLDRTMSYSCAMFREGDSLEDAQIRKLDYHIDNVRLFEGASLLDIGCGWGGILARAAARYPGIRGTGITVAAEQVDYIEKLKIPNAQVHQFSWLEFQPQEKYDAIISIGAIEHFGRVGASSAQKLAGYRHFFELCHKWLKRGGRFSLQSVTYGNMNASDQSTFLNTEIFPRSELPTLAELSEASRGLFEIKTLRNDRLDYAETNRRWLRGLKQHRQEAEQLVGPKKVKNYLDYLSLSVIGFHVGNSDLMRISFERIEAPRYKPAL
jgi:cyclopropane-fatty-acyl-phospholipid synthase